MIPVDALPPATPLTDQANAGAEPSLVCAVNGWVSPPRIVADTGVTLSCVGCEGVAPPPLFTNPVQPVKRSARTPVCAIQIRLTAFPPWSSLYLTRGAVPMHSMLLSQRASDYLVVVEPGEPRVGGAV